MLKGFMETFNNTIVANCSRPQRCNVKYTSNRDSFKVIPWVECSMQIRSVFFFLSPFHLAVFNTNSSFLHVSPTPVSLHLIFLLFFWCNILFRICPSAFLPLSVPGPQQLYIILQSDFICPQILFVQPYCWIDASFILASSSYFRLPRTGT